MSKLKVLVLMSTYNGEKYIVDQLESIINSENVNVDILVRDDGSSDQTRQILSKYKEKGLLEFYIGQNLEPAQSFRNLIECCSLDYDLYAYADQDDIWERNKLILAEKALQGLDTIPALWYCALKTFGDNKKEQYFLCKKERAESLEAVISTFGSTNGCTMVFNKELLLRLKSCKRGKIDMHDSWTHALCLACNGKIIVDKRPLVKYRIHSAQVLGSGDTFKKKIDRFLHPSKLRSETVKVILSSKGLDVNAVPYLQRMALSQKMVNKFRILVKKKPRGMTNTEFIKFKIQILLAMY